MIKDLLTHIRSALSSFSMIADRDTVIVALSGGADSVALLVALAELAPAHHLTLIAAHVHHGLRGPEADRDAAFAEETAKQVAARYGLTIPFYLHRADVKKIAKEQRLSTQEAGRLVRDTYLRGLMEETGATKVATGHTGSDNAETFLMRLITGAGPEGLSGIPPVRLPYIRPLIEATRAEVEAFLTERGIGWIVDSSNLKDDYLRNRVRNHIMPALARVNPSAERRLIEAVAAYRDMFAPVRAAAQEFVDRFAATGAIPIAEIRALPPAVSSEVVKLLVFRAAGHRHTPLRLSRVHVGSVLDLLDAPPAGTKTARLPGGLVARRVYDTLAIERAAVRPASDATPFPETSLTIPGTTPLPSWRLAATAHIIDRSSVESGPEPDRTTALLDYDRITQPPAVRARRPGDRVTLPAKSGTKKLSDIFVDCKVARHERDRAPILVSGTDILWVMGWGADGRYMPTKETRRLLRVTFSRMD